MNRHLATEVVRRTWPSDALRFFVDGYIMALDDVLKDYREHEQQGLVTEGFVDTLIELIRESRDQALATLEVLHDTKILERSDDTLRG